MSAGGYVEQVATLRGHTDRVWHVTFSPCGNLLASSSADRTIRLWKIAADAATQSPTCVYILQDAHTRTIRSTQFSPCGSKLASASFDGTVCVWGKNSVSDEEAFTSWQVIATLEGHENEVKSVAWSLNAQYLATCGRDKSVWIWEVSNERAGSEDDFECVAILTNHSQDVKKVAWLCNQMLVSASYDDSIKLYRDDGSGDWSCVQSLSAHCSTVWAVDSNSNGDLIFSVSDDRTMKVWKGFQRDNTCPNFQCQSTLSGDHVGAIYDVSVNQRLGVVATCGADNIICVYSPNCQSSSEYSLLTKLSNAHDDEVNAVQWSPTQPNILASASDDLTVKLWRLNYHPELGTAV